MGCAIIRAFAVRAREKTWRLNVASADWRELADDLQLLTRSAICKHGDRARAMFARSADTARSKSAIAWRVNPRYARKGLAAIALNWRLPTRSSKRNNQNAREAIDARCH